MFRKLNVYLGGGVMKTRGKIKNMIIDYLFILVGTAIYAPAS